MNKKIKLKCYLWHPENLDDKIAGNITFLPEEEIKIDLFSKFEIDFETSDRLYGISSDSKEITLKDVIKFRELEYYAKDLFIGTHFRGDKIEFRSMNVNFSLLEEWSEITNFEISDTSRFNRRYILDFRGIKSQS
jgi:hypothetical protein